VTHRAHNRNALAWPDRRFLRDETPEIDLEGALSSGKTTACLWKVFNSLHEQAGHSLVDGPLRRWRDPDEGPPAFEAICQTAGSVPSWNAKELAYDFPNGSKCYAYGLKSPDALSRYSKMRGMGVAGIYNDQTEELPEDFSLELRLRLRQPGFPHQLLFSPNPPNVTHWLAQQFPTDNRIPGGSTTRSASTTTRTTCPSSSYRPRCRPIRQSTPSTGA
jgi:hypothetical protein